MRSTPKHFPIKLMLLALFLYSLSGNVLAERNNTELVEVHGKKTSLGLNLKSSNSASNRLGLDLIKIPGSVDVISKKNIAIKADYSSLSAVTRATGFASSASPGNGGTSMSVRGFNGHGAVVQTYDGTRLYVGAGTVTFPADTWTLEKVEVLRGPGSVTNGVGAIGGTVNYVPKAPTFEAPSSEIDLTAGSFGLRRVAFGSGGQINDNVAYRFDTVNHETDGYVDRADEKRRIATGSLLFRPQDNLDIKFSVDYADIDAAPYWGTPLVYDKNGKNGKIDSATRKNNYNVKDGLVEYEDIWPRVKVIWKINALATLENDTYYLKAKRHWRNVESYTYEENANRVDRSFYLEILHDQKQIGNRSNLLLDFDIAGLNNRLSVGAEINQIDFFHTNNSPYRDDEDNDAPPVDFNDPIPGIWAEGVEFPTTEDFTSDTLQYAIFIDDVLQLNEKLSLVVGLRRDKIDYEREDFSRPKNNSERAKGTNDSFRGTSWRLGIVYQPIENTSFYLQTSKAVDSIQSIITASNTELELAEGRQVELGVKQSLWSDRLQYTVAIYDIEKDNLLSSNAGNTQHQIAKQTSRGIEFELFLKPTETFDIDLNIARVNPEFEEFFKENPNTTLPPDDLSGNTPKNIPKTTANLWLNWQPMDRWLLSGGARYVGKRYADDENDTTMPNYTVFDASIQWMATQDLQLTLRGKNLTDEEDYVLAPYGKQWILADGRSAEVSLNYSF
jgi:iron complex outermembrane receptor protein